MRYTKAGLLVFGLGLILGLVVVAVEIKALERLASSLMALGIALLPVALVMDWRRTARARRRGVRRTSTRGRRTRPPTRRRRKPGVPKR
jgi:hypothetical protein